MPCTETTVVTAAIAVNRTFDGARGAIRYTTTAARCDIDCLWDEGDVAALASAIGLEIESLFPTAAIFVEIKLGPGASRDQKAWSDIKAEDGVVQWTEKKGADLLVYLASFVEFYVEEFNGAA